MLDNSQKDRLETAIANIQNFKEIRKILQEIKTGSACTLPDHGDSQRDARWRERMLWRFFLATPLKRLAEEGDQWIMDNGVEKSQALQTCLKAVDLLAGEIGEHRPALALSFEDYE